MNGCREQAVYGGSDWGHKRYCQFHGSEYARKKREFNERQKLLPECENFSTCRNKVPPGRERFCTECQKQYDARVAAQQIEDERIGDLHRCQTVDHLKWWIEKWVL